MALPRVTLAMPAFNQADYVGAAVESLLAQDYQGPLEVLIVDDCSRDATPDVIKDTLAGYRGAFDIRFERNAHNMGIETYNRIMELARGDFIVMAHSDDIALRMRVSTQVQAWQDSGASLISCNAIRIDGAGQSQGLYAKKDLAFDLSLEGLIKNRVPQVLTGSTLAWPRELFDRFEPLQRVKSHNHSDYILPFRASLLKGLHFVFTPLLLYRFHENRRTHRFLSYAQTEALKMDLNFALVTSQLKYRLETALAFQPDNQDEADRRERAILTLNEEIEARIHDWAFFRNSARNQGQSLSWQKLEIGG